MVTEIGVGGTRAGGSQADAEGVYLTFRFTDEQGVEVLHERRSNLRPDKIPAPGWSVLVAYVAGKPETVDYDPRAMRPPDPSVPRGWGAGIFEVEDLGTHGAKSPVAERGLERQRELFRSGRRSQAEIVGVDAPIYRMGLRLKRGAAEVTLNLRVDGIDVETKAWVPAACVPEPGDLIQIATGADRSEVALDSDERYDAPPGQALVFTTPPELAAKRPSLPPIDVEANRPWTPERISEFNATRHADLVAATAQQAPQGHEDPAEQLARVGELLKRGAMNQAQYDSIKANLQTIDGQAPVGPPHPAATVPAPGATNLPPIPEGARAMMAENAKRALAAITDPDQRQVVIQQYRAMGIEVDEDK